MKRVWFAFPTAWDRRQLAACRARWEGRFEIAFAEPGDEETPADLDVLGFIDRAVEDLAGEVHGVTSSSDYPGATVAGAVATALGLPGSRPERILACSHKHASRLRQRRAVPEAVPWFALVDSEAPEASLAELRFPCFVKPVKGAFSVMTRRIDAPEELVAFLSRSEVREFTGGYLGLFDRLLERYGSGVEGLDTGARFFLAEELLHGRMATVEGWVADGEVGILGIVDSVLHPETKSFVRFDYPSGLPTAVRTRMAGVARRAIAALGLDRAMFNVEMIWDPDADRVSIVEVNPRMCGQFADLYEKVDGVNGYEIALALAVGERPAAARRRGEFAVAASFPLRTFEPVRVLSAPGESEMAAAEAAAPGCLVWNECRAGQDLADFVILEDGASARYGIVNLGARDAQELERRFEAVRLALGWDFEPLVAAGRGSGR